jgi:hypothetical protein
MAARARCRRARPRGLHDAGVTCSRAATGDGSGSKCPALVSPAVELVAFRFATGRDERECRDTRRVPGGVSVNRAVVILESAVARCLDCAERVARVQRHRRGDARRRLRVRVGDGGGAHGAPPQFIGRAIGSVGTGWIARASRTAFRMGSTVPRLNDRVLRSRVAPVSAASMLDLRPAAASALDQRAPSEPLQLERSSGSTRPATA